MATERDAGANLIVTLLGPDPTLPFLACGSHLDSVPQGGNYNGAAGVVAGLLALARFRAEGFQPTRTVKLYAGFVPISVQPATSWPGSGCCCGPSTQVKLAALV